MRIKDVIRVLEEKFPPRYAESFDNTGLLTGDPEAEVTGILTVHDALEPVVDEAVREGFNLIIAFHPIIFKGLKSLTGKNYVEKAVIKAVRHNIAIYSPHTAADKHFQGVSYWTARALGLENTRVLMPDPGRFYQLVTYAPHAEAEKVRSAMFAAGAGHIGEYEECSYNVEGYGTFKPSEKANPFVGEKGQRHREPETRISVVFPQHLTGKVLQAMLQAHPYEEPAYEIFKTENEHPEIGLGTIGELPEPMEESAFLEHVKNVLKTPVLRHSTLRGKPVKTVAVIGGSGAFGIDAAAAKGADAFITGDLKYHDFFKGEKILLIDAGHYESEQFVSQKLAEFISEKFPNFAVKISGIGTNPVKYF